MTRVQNISHPISRWILFPMVSLMTVLFILFPGAIAAGITNGLSLCVKTLIPSLFPFMVLASFALYSGADTPITAIFGKLFIKILHLPPRCAGVFLLSLIGGYPVGAKLIASLLDSSEITEHQAERALCFCCNAGPAFLVGAVGYSLLGNQQIGLILLVSQIASAILLAFLFCPKKMEDGLLIVHPKPMSPVLSFVRAVSDSASAMLSLCAFVILFRALLTLAQHIGITDTIVSWFHTDVAVTKAIFFGLFEVTSGCAFATDCGGTIAVLLCCAFTAFSGFSVLFQIRYILHPYALSFRAFSLSKLLHPIFSCSITFVLLKIFSPVVNVFGPSTIPIDSVVKVNSYSQLTTILFLIACIILLFDADKMKANHLVQTHHSSAKRKKQ